MNLREAAQQALEALEDSHQNINPERRYADELTRQIADSITALRAALTEDVPETNFGNMVQVVDCYGDGNVYHTNGMPAVEGPLSKAHRTCQESRHVEPVAYIKGYSKGRCIIQAVDPDWLLPVGMALYRSPPTSQESRQVEPVGYFSINSYGNWEQNESGYGTPFYSSPPQRKPLTDEEIEDLANEFLDWNESGIAEFARAIERVHGTGGEE